MTDHNEELDKWKDEPYPIIRTLETEEEKD